MIAAAAVHRAASRIAGEAVLECGSLDALVELEGGIERRAAGAIGHQLDGLEQAAAADIADVAVIAEPLGQPALELSPEFPDPLEQLLFVDDALHLERRRAGERVREIGVPMLERARALPDGHTYLAH